MTTPKYTSDCGLSHREWWEVNTSIPYGFCWCGCGKRTPLYTRTRKHLGYIKGEPHPFIRGHRRGQNGTRWKGGKKRTLGYILVYAPWHPFASWDYVREHRLVMEDSLGRFLWPWEVVHHINGDKTDNRVANLEVLTSRDHMLHHRPNVNRRRVYDVDTILHLRSLGFPPREIADYEGIDITTYYNALRKHHKESRCL